MDYVMANYGEKQKSMKIKGKTHWLENSNWENHGAEVEEIHEK